MNEGIARPSFFFPPQSQLPSYRNPSSKSHVQLLLFRKKRHMRALNEVEWKRQSWQDRAAALSSSSSSSSSQQQQQDRPFASQLHHISSNGATNGDLSRRFPSFPALPAPPAAAMGGDAAMPSIDESDETTSQLALSADEILDTDQITGSRKRGRWERDDDGSGQGGSNNNNNDSSNSSSDGRNNNGGESSQQQQMGLFSRIFTSLTGGGRR